MTRCANPETVALAQRMAQSVAMGDSAIVAVSFARALFAALQARVGTEVDALLNFDARIIADRHFEAAQKLFARSRIFVEPCRKIIDGQAEMYLATWSDGTARNLTPDELLAMAGESA